LKEYLLYEIKTYTDELEATMLYSFKSLQRQGLGYNKSHLAALAIQHSLVPRATPGTGQVPNTYSQPGRLTLVSIILNLVQKPASLSFTNKNGIN